MSDAAGKKYWDSVWESLPPIRKYDGPAAFEQHSVLYPYLSFHGGGEAFEVGCVPGNGMVYLNKEFGYQVSGIDYSNKLEYVRENLLLNGVKKAELINADFLKFTPDKKYDLVYSGGFVEHFDEYEEVVRKHAELAKSGGIVVIAVPNLTHIHRVLCTLFSRKHLQTHRSPLMQKRILKHTLEKAGLEVLHCEYQKTFRPFYSLPEPILFISRLIQKFLIVTRLDNIGNRFGSPCLVSICKKL